MSAIHASLDAATLLVAIDDTDNLESRGTGHRARQMARAMQVSGLATTLGITRHQLLVDPRIPYTSHNSSACLALRPRAAPDTVLAFCRDFMLDSAAVGSDVGLCCATPSAARQVIDYGLRAKQEVLDQDAARRTADGAGIALEGLTGTRGGIIGALAAVGLYAHGDDGRYLWVEHLRDLGEVRLTVGELLARTGVERVAEIEGPDLSGREDATVNIHAWARAVRVAGQAVLLVERSPDDTADYVVAAKQRIKAFRP